MNIINYYYDKTSNIISQVDFSTQNFDYMNWLVLESIKSVYLLSNDLVSKDQKRTFSCLKTIIKNNSVTSANNSTLCSFIEAAKQEFKVFSGRRLDSQKILNNLCEQLKKICVLTKENNNDTHYWDTPKYHNNIPDSQSAKEILISMYLFCILLFLYCIQSNSKLFSVLTTDLTNISKNSEDNIHILDEFYQKGYIQQIQFFLPIEADVTLSYFLYRYVFDKNIRGKIGESWVMGKIEEDPSSLAVSDIISKIDKFKKSSSKGTTKEETFRSWVKALIEFGIFDSTKIDSVEKIKILCLRQYILRAKWNDTDRQKRELDLIDFIKSPKDVFFREFGTHVKTDADTVGTILASELMKELPINDICFYVGMCLDVELGIKNIQNILKVFFTNSSYRVEYRNIFINVLDSFNQNHKKNFKSKRVLYECNPICLLFVKNNLYRARACLQDVCRQLMCIGNQFDDLIFSVHPKLYDNPQQQKEILIFDNLTGSEFSKCLAYIDKFFHSPNDERKELSRLCTFFRLYFPEKYSVEQRCTMLDLVSVYELLDEIKQSSLPEKIKKAFSAKNKAHDEASIVQALVIAKIEMHNMSSNYNSMFIPTILHILNKVTLQTDMNTNTCGLTELPDGDKLNELCDSFKQINFWVEQLCRYLFGRNIDGKYACDISPGGKSVNVDTTAKKVFDNIFVPMERKTIENIRDYYSISSEMVNTIMYDEINKNNFKKHRCGTP